MGPLKGIKILDLSMVVAGPFCTLILGDLGADIIKIEPPEGDVVRNLPGPERNGVGVGILNWNRSKRGMVLDLKREGAAEVFLRMAEQADVVIQNVRPGVVDRLGVGYEAVSRRNPKIVYCSIAGYGFSGPYRDKPAYDPIIQGVAGVMISQRTQGRPRAVKNILADKITAMTATISILAALQEVAREGRGKHLEIAMIDAVAYYMFGDTAVRHTLLPHEKGIAPPMSSAEPFKTADGFITIAPLTDKHWKALLEAVGHPEWFEGEGSRTERVRQAARNLIELFPSQPSEYWLERIEKADVPCGRVNDYDSIWEDPQYLVNESFYEYEHPQAGRVRASRPPARISGKKLEHWRHAPGLGEHTDAILADFGFTGQEIVDLHSRNVVK